MGGKEKPILALNHLTSNIMATLEGRGQWGGGSKAGLRKDESLESALVCVKSNAW